MLHLRPFLAIIAAFSLTLIGAGCSAGSDEPSGPDASSEGATITVLAAASLQDVFEEAGAEYEKESGVHVEFNFAGSSALVTQLEAGSPGDVLATANSSTMDQAVSDSTVTDPTPFATNTLTLAVAPGNPKGIKDLTDLARSDVLFVRCAAAVPCGSASDKVLADHPNNPVSEENSVTDVLGKVSSGQADVGLVYATDIARADGKTEAVDFPEASDAVNHYPIALTANTAQAEAAQGFVDLITGPTGQQLLKDAGFGAP